MEKKVYSVKGEELRTVELNDDVFNTEYSEGSVYYAIRNENANKRVLEAKRNGTCPLRSEKITGMGWRRHRFWTKTARLFVFNAEESEKIGDAFYSFSN